MTQIIAGLYEIQNQIGAGGGGIVYLGRHIHLDKQVVLKADKRKLSADTETLRREVDMLKNLTHTYIPQVYDFVQEGDTVYTVMDYIEGESLDKLLGRGQKITQPQIIKWACQLLAALKYLHSRPPHGILHGDIKPANIMLRPSGDICLIDYNIALALGEDGAHTIGVEFRSSSDDSLKRAAQNYRIIPGSINDRVGGGAAGSGSSINMAPVRYTVKSGDTLWKIAKQFYGNGAMWTKIYADNKSTIKNPNRIYVGQVLLIYPSIGDGTYITQSGAKTYTVKRGDTLWSIAEGMYGKGKRWKKIYEANKGTLSDPNKLYAGQILIIPN